MHYEVLDLEAPEESKNEYRTKGSPRKLQVVNCLRSGAHPSGPSGSDNFCFLASCERAVLGKFMGRAPAATAAAIQPLCAAAVQFLWGVRGWSPMGLWGLSLVPRQREQRRERPREAEKEQPPDYS